MQKNIQEYIINDENELDEIDLDFLPGDRIFFYGDLGTGKSTFIRHQLRKYLNLPNLIVRSPTYTYYQKYTSESGQSIFHCDLYRLEDYNTWVSIGGEEISQDENSIILIEWPEILADTVIPTKKVSIELMETGERKISVMMI
ncbi:tRNA (adenosine(37)-N6)-threonylcarbamoyltransferase complex ATPase subunit type 1 TsaE [Candidatus Gracilibacteria bacterium]|nr:tRNA (adenosine(37)-N6)-threonylcarbamoyltransferase complex ATPase subunit type 1 TsaE [Candidatus Gracilibacteria bacterium]